MHCRVVYPDSMRPYHKLVKLSRRIIPVSTSTSIHTTTLHNNTYRRTTNYTTRIIQPAELSRKTIQHFSLVFNSIPFKYSAFHQRCTYVSFNNPFRHMNTKFSPPFILHYVSFQMNPMSNYVTELTSSNSLSTRNSSSV